MGTVFSRVLLAFVDYSVQKFLDAVQLIPNTLNVELLQNLLKLAVLLVAEALLVEVQIFLENVGQDLWIFLEGRDYDR